MLSAADIAAEQDGALRDLFEAGAELALQIQADAMGAESADERARIAAGFHRVSRGVRQTAALRIRVARAAEDAGRTAEDREAQQARARLDARKRQLKARVERLIWTEAEGDEDVDLELSLRLEDLVRIEADDPEPFLAEPFDSQVHRICKELGIQAPSPLAGEGVGRSPTDEGSHDGSSAMAVRSGETPHPTPFGGHLLPQGEKETDIADPFRSSA